MSALRSGVFIPPYHSPIENPRMALRADLELVEFCETLGFHEAWYGEHYSGGVEIIASPELMIAAAAERTKTIKLGAGVISLPYHDPLNVAHRIVQLDHMTGGRIMIGFGAGSLVHDATMRGIEVDQTRERLAQATEVILRLLKGETVTQKTDWFTLNQASLHLSPYSDPMPEIVVASTHTPSGSRLAGRHGIGMLCMTASQTSGYDALDSNWKTANKIAADHGTTVSLDGLRLVAPIHIAETRDAAYQNVRFGIERYLDYSFSLSPSRRERAVGLDPIEVIREQRGGIIGTPSDVVDLIKRFQSKVGQFGCLLHLEHNWADRSQTRRSYELYAQYVMPQLRDWNERRLQSLQMFKNEETEIDRAKTAAAAKMFEKHRSEQNNSN